MKAYKHKVQYYETDKMGITHHSNYVRWMEEARIEFLSGLGWDYERLEEEGIVSPVLGIQCKYIHSTTFPDVITISVKVKEVRGVRLKLSYLMTDEEGNTVMESSSEHCFLNEQGMPLRLQKKYPDFYEALQQNLESE